MREGGQMTDNIQGGYILLSRLLIESRIFKKPPAYIKIFIYILFKVRYSNGIFPRGTNLFNFSTEDIIPGVTKNQIYEFIRWAKSGNDPILTTQKTTRGIVVKVNNYSYFQNSGNYELQDSFRNNSKIATKQLQHYNRRKKERKKERDSKLSLSHEEREILKNYLSRKKGKGKVDDIDAYMETMIQNGSYLPILEKEKARIERVKQEEVIPPPENFEEEEEPLSAQELQEMMRSKLVWLQPKQVKEG